MKGRVRANCRFYEDLNRIADQIWILDVNKRIMAKAFAGNEEFFKCVPPELRYFIYALFDSDDHSFAIDIGDFQADSLGDAQPGSVTDRQDGAMLEALYAA